MPSAAQLRDHIQAALAHKAPSALTPAARAMRPLLPTGCGEVDALLEGGLPAGAITEFTGPACSGRVSLALAFVAGRTLEGQVCAWVDASDGFDPASAEAGGVALERLLWVRCGQNVAQTDQAPQHVTAGSRFAVERSPDSAKTCIGMHPRMEEHGMATALEGLLQVRDSVRMSGKPGTPGAPNRPLGQQPRAEQIATDRLPARRGEHALEQKSKLAAGQNGVVHSLSSHADALAHIAPRCAETQQGFARAKQARITAVEPTAPVRVPQKASGKSSWDRLDQAIRATDLLLQGGGFSCIVLDLSGVEAEFANRIPLATWFRFRAAADRTRASLLVLSRHACTGSSGEILLRMQACEPEGTTVMTRVPLHVELARQRFSPQPQPPVQQGKIVTMRKPPRSATTADWAAPCASLKAAGVAR